MASVSELDELQGTQTEELATRFVTLLSDKRSESAATTGRDLLEAQFAKRNGVGVEMAIRSAGALGDADEIAASCEALVGDLLSALR
jgi:hypothetical protein